MVDLFRDALRIAHLDFPLSGWIDAISRIPAGLMRLEHLGRIAAGASADLVVVPVKGTAAVLATLGRDRTVIRGGRPLG